MNIRVVEQKDLNAIEPLLQIPELQEADGTYVPKSYLEKQLGNPFFLLIEEQEVLGFILAEELRAKVVIIHFLSVKTSERNKHLGKQLVDYLEAKCKELSINYVFLYAPTTNENTLTFYEKRGYLGSKEYRAYGKDIK